MYYTKRHFNGLSPIGTVTAPAIHVVVALVLMVVGPMTVFAQDKQLKRTTLSNGIDVIVKEDHARKVAAIQLWVKVGSADETGSELGISHLIEHMAFKGTEKRGVGEIAAEVEALGGEINAYTSWDETVFHVTVPSRATLKGLDIITDAVLSPTLDPVELEKEKQVVIEEILEGEERPERKIAKLLFKTAYISSPYRWPVIGFRDVVEGFTREDIVDFRKKWYVPENLFFVIAGDVDAKEIIDSLETLTARFRPKGFYRPPRPVEPEQEEVRVKLTRDSNAREARLHLAYHIPSLTDSDVNALDLGADILGARESSRLIRVLKKEKGLVNDISAYAMTPKKPGLFVISANLLSENLAPAIKGILAEVEEFAENAPSKEDVERARTHIESQHLYARETVQGVARFLGSFEADTGDPEYEKKYLKLNRITSPQEVAQVAKTFLKPPNLSLVVMLPEDEAPGVTEADLRNWLETAVQREDKNQEEEKGPEIRKFTLKNGIRVILSRDTSNPLVSFRIACLGGKRSETADTQGIMNFVSNMLTKGAGSMSEVEISKKIEDLGGKLQGFSGYDSTGITASFFSRRLKEGLELMALVFRDPTFPKDKLERERKLIINRIETEPDRPIQYMIRNINQTLFPEHPYGYDRLGAMETVSAFTKEDLKKAFSRAATPSNIVIAGIGDLDLDATHQLIETLFGDMNRSAYSPPSPEAASPMEEPITKVIKIPRAKAHIGMAFRTVSITDPDRYPLETLNNMLAGQGGRLFLELRDRQSLAYVVTSFVRPGVDPGMFAFYIACDHSKVDQAISGLSEEIRKVRDEEISNEEVEEAKENIIGNHLIALQSTWARAETRCLNELYGLGHDYHLEFVEKISQVTPEQVRAVARRYLDPEKAAIVKILPTQERD
jgi:zinc protease